MSRNYLYFCTAHFEENVVPTVKHRFTILDDFGSEKQFTKGSKILLFESCVSGVKNSLYIARFA